MTEQPPQPGTRATTPVFGWRVPVLGDAPNVPYDITALAEDVERTVALDTGFRDISSSLINGWTTTRLWTRRIGTTVWMVAQDLVCPATFNMDITGPVPAGFTLLTSPMAHALIYTSPYNLSATVAGLSTNWVRSLTVLTAGQKLRFTYAYPTTDPWPDTLPGTPVLLDDILDAVDDMARVELRPEDAQ